MSAVRSTVGPTGLTEMSAEIRKRGRPPKAGAKVKPKPDDIPFTEEMLATTNQYTPDDNGCRYQSTVPLSEAGQEIRKLRGIFGCGLVLGGNKGDAHHMHEHAHVFYTEVGKWMLKQNGCHVQDSSQGKTPKCIRIRDGSINVIAMPQLTNVRSRPKTGIAREEWVCNKQESAGCDETCNFRITIHVAERVLSPKSHRMRERKRKRIRRMKVPNPAHELAASGDEFSDGVAADTAEETSVGQSSVERAVGPKRPHIHVSKEFDEPDIYKECTIKVYGHHSPTAWHDVSAKATDADVQFEAKTLLQTHAPRAVHRMLLAKQSDAMERAQSFDGEWRPDTCSEREGHT